MNNRIFAIIISKVWVLRVTFIIDNFMLLDNWINT